MIRWPNEVTLPEIFESKQETMIPHEIVQQIRRIQIRTSHLVDDVLAGEYLSAFKGRGIEFEEVRPYIPGDDVRAIDWNVTARYNEPFVKLFREERELTVMLLVDISLSESWGTHFQTKRELVTEVAATLAFSAIKNNDKVGLILFSDGVEKFVPPRKGSRHVLRCIRELLYCEPVGRGTDISSALDYLDHTIKRRSVVFLISDFLDKGYDRKLRVARRRHDIVPVAVNDPRETELPNLGLIELRDQELGEVRTIDTASRRQRERFSQQTRAAIEQRNEMFRRLKMDPIQLYTGEDFVEPIRQFFHRRERAR